MNVKTVLFREKELYSLPGIMCSSRDGLVCKLEEKSGGIMLFDLFSVYIHLCQCKWDFRSLAP